MKERKEKILIMYQYKAKVIRIIDGDSLILEVDLGFRLTQIMTFRLYGINTPEIVGESRAKGLEAKAFVEKYLPVGKEVRIQTYKDKKEKYGRYLADIFLDEIRIDYPNGDVQSWGNTSINEVLVEIGLAMKYTGEGVKS